MKRHAFTLIELLIVVAIIAILAAIAVPNFLEAQTRAKVSRVKADMRSVATAIEAYAVDYNKYPMLSGFGANNNRGPIDLISVLSTPVAYMSSTNVRDPFNKEGIYYAPTTPVTHAIWYYNITEHRREGGRGPVSTKWALQSWGPDRERATPIGFPSFNLAPGDPSGFYPNAEPWQYDPTNGTVSTGDIVKYHGQNPP